MKKIGTLTNLLCLGIAASAAAACNTSADPSSVDIGTLQDKLQTAFPVNTGSYSLHLEETLRFNSAHPTGDPDRGRALFGLAADLETIDTSGALFEGPSQAFGGVVESNGRACATCHRGLSVALGMPPPPMSAHIPADDPFFTGLHADAQQDPDGAANQENFGLMKYRPGRFNLARTEDDPFRKIFFWRKSPALFNVVFSRGFLLDGRMRVMFETDRGAVFSHTQESDQRFDDLFTVQDGRDLEAFQFQFVTDERLKALLDPSNPLFSALANNPFYTVALTTDAQRAGKDVFARDCMTCHNTPNVFNNLSNVHPLGTDPDRPPNFPPFGPNVGRTFNVGVSERNAHNLRFTVPVAGGGFEPVVLPLAQEDGTLTNLTVTIDVGLAATTARADDVGRFKVPQLRNIKALGPYFHDNSANTLTEVVQYFNSSYYNRSRDGSRFPIRETAKEQADLVEFLKAL